MERGEEFSFKVRFWGQSARYVRETQFHPSQRITTGNGQLALGNGQGEDDVVIFAAKACGMKAVSRWVLSFGCEAEVLEPEELRELVRGELRRGVERY